jgi:hypothetical protein
MSAETNPSRQSLVISTWTKAWVLPKHRLERGHKLLAELDKLLVRRERHDWSRVVLIELDYALRE